MTLPPWVAAPLEERAALPDEKLTIHSLWHTFATTRAEEDTHPPTAWKMLVHSEIRMTCAIYTRATESMPDSARAALEVAISRSGC